MRIPLLRTVGTRYALCVVAVIAVATSTSAQINEWVNPGSGNWDNAANWSSGWPHISQSEVRISNAGNKAVAIQPGTPSNFPSTMTVQNLRLDGVPPNTNLLLLNYSGTSLPLRVVRDFNLGANGRVLMLYSGLNVSNMFDLNGVFDQEGGELVFSNAFTSIMQIEGGHFNLTNGFVFGRNMYLGGANDGFVYQDSGLVALNWLGLGDKPTVPGSQGNGTYALQSGWLIVGAVELIGNNGFGTLTQNGGTNSVSIISMPNGTYVKNGGGLFAGEVYISNSGLTHAGGAATITNLVRLNGQGPTKFKMLGGSLTTPRIELLSAGEFTQSNGTVNVTSELFMQENSANAIAMAYYLYGGNLFSARTTVSFSRPSTRFIQYGGTHIVTNALWLNGTSTTYELRGGTLSSPTINLSGNMPNPPQFAVLGAPAYTVINENISVSGSGAVTVQDSVQQFGRLSFGLDTSVNLAGNSAVMRFADSHTNNWGARLLVLNWNGSPAGGGTDQLIFGTNSSALTASQLAQIDFINPAGFPPGTNHARILATGEVVPDGASPPGGIVNSWIAGSGNWDVPSNWSLGIRPDSSQAVMITNSGWKAVAINASTPVNFPGSMTVSNLTIRGAWDTYNTLLLNFFGTTVPLTVLNGLTLADNAQILNFNSGLDILGGAITVTNAQIVQDGGYVGAMKVTMNLQNAVYQMTNGLLEAGSVQLGSPVSAHFNQYGGLAIITNLVFGQGTPSAGGHYALYGGELRLPNGLRILGGNNAFSSYFQAGGTNRTTSVFLEPNIFGLSPTFTLNGGLLADNDVTLLGDNFGSITLVQNGGTHIVTNLLSMAGGASAGASPKPAGYQVNGGTLIASRIELNGHQGDATFSQTNGITQAGQIQASSGGPFTFFTTRIGLSGGTLNTGSLSVNDGGTLTQTGGKLVVTNSLNLVGFRNPGITIYTRYTLLGGTLSGSNLNIGGDWIIGDSSGTNRISNPGTISLGHLLQIGNANEQLGRFILVSNSTIDLAGSASRLSFANSSTEIWSPGATLVVSNWNGSFSGGGAEQLRFGTGAAGLSAAQLNQMRFCIGPDLYTAGILSTGEIVPDQLVPAGVNLAFSQQANNLTLTWPGGWTLQSSTNVTGPYTDVQATSPYTVNVTLEPQEFFRLRSTQ